MAQIPPKTPGEHEQLEATLSNGATAPCVAAVDADANVVGGAAPVQVPRRTPGEYERLEATLTNGATVPCVALVDIDGNILGGASPVPVPRRVPGEFEYLEAELSNGAMVPCVVQVDADANVVTGPAAGGGGAGAELFPIPYGRNLIPNSKLIMYPGYMTTGGHPIYWSANMGMSRVIVGPEFNSFKFKDGTSSSEYMVAPMMPIYHNQLIVFGCYVDTIDTPSTLTKMIGISGSDGDLGVIRNDFTDPAKQGIGKMLHVLKWRGYTGKVDVKFGRFAATTGQTGLKISRPFAYTVPPDETDFDKYDWDGDVDNKLVMENLINNPRLAGYIGVSDIYPQCFGSKSGATGNYPVLEPDWNGGEYRIYSIITNAAENCNIGVFIAQPDMAGKTFTVGCYIEDNSELDDAITFISFTSMSNLTIVEDHSRVDHTGKIWLVFTVNGGTSFSNLVFGKVAAQATGQGRKIRFSRPFMYEGNLPDAEWTHNNTELCTF